MNKRSMVQAAAYLQEYCQKLISGPHRTALIQKDPSTPVGTYVILSESDLNLNTEDYSFDQFSDFLYTESGLVIHRFNDARYIVWHENQSGTSCEEWELT